MSDLLRQAFAALGEAPTTREVELVATTLRESSDEAATVAIEAAAAPGASIDPLAEIALASGSSGFAALDLMVEVLSPGVLGAYRGATR